MCNMVPDADQVRDPDDERPKRTVDQIKEEFINNSNILQPQEILGGHCIAEFQLNNNILIDSIEDSVKNKSKANILDHLFEDHEDSDKILKMITRYTEFYGQKFEIHFDFCMRSII